MNILIDIIPASARRYVYAAYAFIGLVFGAWQIVEQPAWITTALSVYAFVGTALGLTAYANTRPPVAIEAVEPVTLVTGDPGVRVTLTDGTQEHFTK
jgi:hypothetical protein